MLLVLWSAMPTGMSAVLASSTTFKPAAMLAATAEQFLPLCKSSAAPARFTQELVQPVFLALTGNKILDCDALCPAPEHPQNNHILILQSQLRSEAARVWPLLQLLPTVCRSPRMLLRRTLIPQPNIPIKSFTFESSGKELRKPFFFPDAPVTYN